MTFRLNDKHREKLPGTARRGERTKAKEALYKRILARIGEIKPNFNVGISTGGGPENRWDAPYQHWAFQPKEFEYDREMTKGNEKGG